MFVSKAKFLLILAKNLPANSGLFFTSSSSIVTLKSDPTFTAAKKAASGPNGLSNVTR